MNMSFKYPDLRWLNLKQTIIMYIPTLDIT